MVGLNPNMSVSILNVNRLNTLKDKTNRRIKN